MQLQWAAKAAELGPELAKKRQLTAKRGTLQWRNSSLSPLFRLHISIFCSCEERRDGGGGGRRERSGDVGGKGICKNCKIGFSNPSF